MTSGPDAEADRKLVMVSLKSRQVTRLRLTFLEGTDCHEVVATVVKRGINGPGGEGRYWIVQTPPTVFIKGRPPASYLIVGPGGREGRLAVLDEGEIKAIVCQMMLDNTGLAPDIDRFDFTTAYDFGRGFAEVCE
jgi:hypothetical protein